MCLLLSGIISSNMKNIAYRYLTAAIWVYFTLLFGWLLLYLFTGDLLMFISLANILAVYFFLPLPLILFSNLFLRRKEIWVLTIAAGVAFAWLWGGYFLPKSKPASTTLTNSDTLTVMTFNVLGRQSDVLPQIQAIREENADVVLLQEVNVLLADALRTELADSYPYQVLDPREDVSGMAVLSKYPLQSTGVSLPLFWVGQPQVLSMDWNDKQVTLINFHMAPSTLGNVRFLSTINRLREDEARALVDATRQSGPAILGGDANTTPLSDAYGILTTDFKDAWKEAGFGLGHTFPGSDVPGSSRPNIAGVPAPMWLARIDYIFSSADFQTIASRQARFDGISDHRGVIAVLKWSDGQE
jgi:endonuclease/exonuclease/phosphatase (EEP) superfamily protein YafD